MKNLLFLISLLSINVTQIFAQIKPTVEVTRGHTGHATCMDISEDGTFMVTGGGDSDKNIKIWDLGSGREFRTIAGFSGRIASVKLHKSLPHVLVQDNFGSVQVLDYITGKLIYKLDGESDYTVVAGYCNDFKNIYFKQGNKMKVVDPVAGSLVNSFDFGYWINPSLMPDGKSFVTYNYNSKSIEVYAFSGSKINAVVVNKAPQSYLFRNSISKDGRYILVLQSLTQKYIELYDLKSKKYIRNINHGGLVNSTAFINNQEFVLFDNTGNLKGYNALTKKQVFDKPKAIMGQPAFLYLPKNKDYFIAVGYFGYHFFTNEGDNFRNVKPLGGPVHKIAYDSKGRYFAELSNHWSKYGIKIWDLHQNRLVDQLSSINTMIFHPDGEQLVFQKTTDTISFYHIERKSVTKRIPIGYGVLTDIKINNDGTLLGTSDYVGNIKIYDVETQKLKKTFNSMSGGVKVIAFSPEGKYVLGACMDASIKVWELSSGKEVKKLTGHIIAISDIKFSDDGKRLFTSSWDKTIKMWDPVTWSELKSFKGHSDKVMSLDISGDNTKLISSAGNSTVNEADNSIRVWNTQSGASTCKLTAHEGQVHQVIFEDETGHIFSCSDDGKIILWDQNKCKPLVTYMSFGKDDYVAYTPDNYYTATKGSLPNIGFRLNDKLYDFEQFDLLLNRPDIVASRTGKSPQVLIDAFNQAYKKRLKKMNFKEEDLGKSYQVPLLKILTEDIPLVVNENSINIKVEASDKVATIDRINVYVNEVPVYGANGIDLRSKSAQSIQKDLTINLLPGKNLVQITCLNSLGAESLKKSFEIVRNGEEKGDLYLIEIDVSNFKDTRFNLKYPGKDAKDFREKIEKSAGLYNKVHEIELKDEKATKVEFEKLFEFVKSASYKDVVIVYIVGHGVLDAKLDYYYATYDMDFNNPAGLGISYSSIEKLLSSIKSYKKLLIMDTCHSGEVDKDEVEQAEETPKPKGKVKFRAAGVAIRQKKPFGLYNAYELSKVLFADLRKGTGATVISSAGGAEFAFEGEDWDNGLFTYCFLEAMNKESGADINGDGQITISEIQSFVYDKVTKLSDGKQRPNARQENNLMDFRIW